MNQNDAEHHDMSEDNTAGEEKMTPVSEAIRYRKRAQQAEKQLAELTEELSQQRQRAETLDQQLSTVRRQQLLREALAAAGATDMEAAMLLGQSRLEGDEGADIAGVVEQLCAEKAYLFAAPGDRPGSGKTAGVRHRADSRISLDGAATRAAKSGNRADMQEYLRLRRAYV